MAKRLNRKSIGIEYEETYFKTGLRRLDIKSSYNGEQLEAVKKTTAIKNTRNKKTIKDETEKIKA